MSIKPPAQATTPSANSTPGGTALERMARQKGKTPQQEMARLKKAAKEFEAFFTYQMLKTMRQTTLGETKSKNMFGDGLGKGVFTDMFDMELSRSMPSDNPRSLASILSKSLEKRVAAEFTDTSQPPDALKALRELQNTKLLKLHSTPTSLSTEHPAIDLKNALPVGRIAVPLTQREGTVPRRDAPVTDVSAKSENILPKAEAAKVPVAEKREESSIRRRFGALIDQAAERHQIDSALIEAVISTESSGNPHAVSKAGARGLMQLMPITARELNVTDPHSPADSIEAGAKYLSKLRDRFGSIPLALAAYNAGPTRVVKHKGIPPIEETRNYVKKVLSQYETMKLNHSVGNSKVAPITDR